MTFRSLALIALAASAFAGCRVPSDLGVDCRLVRKDPSDSTGKKFLYLTEGDIKPNKDYLSFGSVECEDLVCVRDAAYTRPNAAATDQALGYCSRNCVQGTTCPAANEADDKDPVKRLNCRPLLLDEVTLAAICQAEPQKCTDKIGNTKTPYFCARGSLADAGT